jgi:hypothetical protein
MTKNTVAEVCTTVSKIIAWLETNGYATVQQNDSVGFKFTITDKAIAESGQDDKKLQRNGRSIVPVQR